jgi:hypothetical protein
MRPVTSNFLQAVTGSHQMAARARVLTTYQTGTSPTGTEIPVIDGDVQFDWTADVYATLDLTTDGTGWDPRHGNDTRQPYGTEIYVERGIVAGGSTEWVGLGYFKIMAVEQDTPPSGPLRITASDRMQTVIDGQILQPITFASTATVAAVFTQLVGDVYPDVTISFDWDATSDTLGAAQVTDSDRHGFLTQLATSRGKVFYFDYTGTLIVKDIPQPGDPVWQVAAGAGGVLVSAQRTLNRDGVYNAVVAQADGGDTTQPVAIAIDTDPTSPTYFYGPYGQVPQFWSSPLITTAAQAQAAAGTILLRSSTLPRRVAFTAVPNPALEPLDLVEVSYGGGAPTDELTIDTLMVPLTAAQALSGTAHTPAAAPGVLT